VSAPSAPRRLAVRVTADAVRQLRRGHPWLFAGSITGVKGDGKPGDLAVVFDDRRRFVAIGLYDPTSPIRVRLLHHGGPMPIDEGFWAGRIDASLERRAPLVARGDTTAYRCVHGENDGLPGLVVDRYESTLVLKVYTAAWLTHLPVIVDVLRQRLAPDRVLLRFGRTVDEGDRAGLVEGTALVGAVPEHPVPFLENGLRMEADVVRGQKTGHFLDQRDNRRLLRRYTAGTDVLDVFSCTGGFSLHAAAGGARSVHSVDAAAGALATGRRNLALNGHLPEVGACRHDSTTGDAFEVLGRLAHDGVRFDVVVIDPPSFAARRSSVDRALHAYGRLTDLGLAVVRPGGLLLQASCSSRIDEATFVELVRRRAAAARVGLDELHRTGHPVDHPVGFPEGAYLKALFARVG
jgi:23S rRNA (cytosine1962-C5)-methyltransferase